MSTEAAVGPRQRNEIVRELEEEEEEEEEDDDDDDDDDDDEPGNGWS